MTDEPAIVDKYDTQLGARIAEARRAAGLSQAELAEHLHLVRSSVANIEAGRQRILAASLMEIGSALGVDPRWLLTGDSYAPRRQPVRRMARADADQIRRAVTVLRSIADGLDVLDGLTTPPPKTGASQP